MRQTLLLLTVLIASLSFTAFAQDNNSSFSYGGVKAAPGKYIVIAQLKAWGGGDGILTFDYGQIDEKGRRSSGSRTLTDDSGKNVKGEMFLSYLNYLLKHGWILYGYIGDNYCYLYKEVSNNSEITEGIQFQK